MTAAAATRISLSAPAKLNLGLRIVGVRADGYHLLDSLFVPLDLADALVVSTRQGSPRVDFSSAGDPESPDGAGNLAARAATAFLEASGISRVLEVTLRKQIPVGAGLGGGSSDAGAVLRALCRLHPDGVSRERLLAIALGLGADVPFFLDPRPARVSGIGDQIAPLSGLPGLWVVLANPGVSLATAAVYAELDRLEGALTSARSRPTLRPLVGQASLELSSEALEAWLTGGQLQNDLATAAQNLCPEIRELEQRLSEVGALAVGMSGSGATVFGVFSDREDAAAGLSRAAFESPIWARVAATAGSR